MRVLLDTNALLWAAVDPSRLSSSAGRVVADATVARCFSTASAWEIAIKMRLGKLRAGLPAESIFRILSEDLIATPLSVELHHAIRVYDLPDHHRDPLDRLIIAQALSEKLPVITSDPVFKKYKVQVIW